MNDSTPSPQTPLATAEETAAFVEAQAKEYGTYVAVAPISFNGVPAYNAGDPVPVSNVEKYGYLDQKLVAKTNSKAAQDMVRAIHEANLAAANQAVPVVEPVSLGVQIQEK